MNDVHGEIIVVASFEELAASAAERIVSAALESVAARGAFTLGLSGGKTPVPVFRQLARASMHDRMPWLLTDVYWCDERCVGPNDPASNFGMARQLLLSRVPLSNEQIHRIHAEDSRRDAAAARYAVALPAHLDLLVLGIGDDGHIASLFPHSAALQEHERLVVVVSDAPKLPRCRITITPPVIENARALLTLATGATKADAVARALIGSPNLDETPAQLARRGDWLLDADAAGALPKGL